MTSYHFARKVWPHTTLPENFDLIPLWQKSLTSYHFGRKIWPHTTLAEKFDLIPLWQKILTSYHFGRKIWPHTTLPERVGLVKSSNDDVATGDFRMSNSSTNYVFYNRKKLIDNNFVQLRLVLCTIIHLPSKSYSSFRHKIPHTQLFKINYVQLVAVGLQSKNKTIVNF